MSIPNFQKFSAVRPPHDRKEVEPCGGPRKVIFIYNFRIALFLGRVNGFHRTILINPPPLPDEKIVADSKVYDDLAQREGFEPSNGF